MKLISREKTKSLYLSKQLKSNVTKSILNLNLKVNNNLVINL